LARRKPLNLHSRHWITAELRWHMRIRKGPTYSGALGRPKPFSADSQHSTPTNEGEPTPDQETLLRMLLIHFKIDPSKDKCWLALSLALAKAHVPSFSYARRRGPPRKWDELRDALARVAIDEFIREHPGHGVTSATLALAKQSHWKAFLGNGKRPAEQLRQAYYRAIPVEVEWISEFLEEDKSSGSQFVSSMWQIAFRK
jgi:hypothetical protein